MKRLAISLLVVIIFIPFFLYAQEPVAYTIRCKDGVVLVLGSREAIIRTKEFIKDYRDKDAKTLDLAEKIREEKIAGIEVIEEHLKSKPIPRKEEKVRIISLTVKEAEERGLIPHISNLSLFEAKRLLEIMGIKVVLPAEEIGKTGLRPPVDIVVQSAGCEVGDYAHIFVDGVDVSLNKRGYNLAVVNEKSGEVEKVGNFDTRLEPGGESEAHKLAEFIKDIPPGKIVLAAIKDEGSKYLTEEAQNALRSIGSALYPQRRGFRRFSHALIGVKGAKPGEADEERKFGAIELTVLRGEGEPKEWGEYRGKVVHILSEVGAKDKIKIAY